MENVINQLTALTEDKLFLCLFIAIVAVFLWWAYHAFICLPDMPILTAYDLSEQQAQTDCATIKEMIRKCSTDNDFEYVQTRIERFSGDYVFRVKRESLNKMIVELYTELYSKTNADNSLGINIPVQSCPG